MWTQYLSDLNEPVSFVHNSYNCSCLLSILLNLSLPGCASILQPLHGLLSAPSKDIPLAWMPDDISSFTHITNALAEASLLCHPQLDAPTCIIVDASELMVGAVLQQQIDTAWCLIAYFAMKLCQAESGTALSTMNCWPFTLSSGISTTLWKVNSFMCSLITNPWLCFSFQYHNPLSWSERHIKLIAKLTLTWDASKGLPIPQLLSSPVWKWIYYTLRPHPSTSRPWQKLTADWPPYGWRSSSPTESFVTNVLVIVCLLYLWESIGNGQSFISDGICETHRAANVWPQD